MKDAVDLHRELRDLGLVRPEHDTHWHAIDTVQQRRFEEAATDLLGDSDKIEELEEEIGGLRSDLKDEEGEHARTTEELRVLRGELEDLKGKAAAQ